MSFWKSFALSGVFLTPSMPKEIISQESDGNTERKVRSNKFDQMDMVKALNLVKGE